MKDAARNTDCRFHVVLPAAGAGRRMGAELPKQYLPLAGKCVIEHTLDAVLACPGLERVVVVVAPEDDRWPEIGQRYPAGRVSRANGAAERCESVLNGLLSLSADAADSDFVLVHDAARPCVTIDDIRQLMDSLRTHPCGGLLGVPVADTMKRVDRNGAVCNTVDRTGLWHALTPQMFRLGLLRDALRAVIAAGELVTDEAGAMERAGHVVQMVQGRRDNLKITLPADLALAEFYLQTRQSR